MAYQLSSRVCRADLCRYRVDISPPFFLKPVRLYKKVQRVCHEARPPQFFGSRRQESNNRFGQLAECAYLTGKRSRTADRLSKGLNELKVETRVPAKLLDEP